MVVHSKKMRLLLPLLAMILTLSIATSAQAKDGQNQYDDRRSSGPDASLQINFGSAPRWAVIQGTNVRGIRRGERSDYDMFHYGRFYYAYSHDNGRWYRSRGYSGRFMLIDDRAIPREVRGIPRKHWRNYPPAWGINGGNPASNGSGSGSGNGNGKGKGGRGRD